MTLSKIFRQTLLLCTTQQILKCWAAHNNVAKFSKYINQIILIVYTSKIYFVCFNFLVAKDNLFLFKNNFYLKIKVIVTIL